MATGGFEQSRRRSAFAPPSWALVAFVTVVAFVLGVRDIRDVLFDDAAITFRYAWRLAHGHGFTYNDGDRTNGASAPLYTLVLASLSRAGLGLDGVASAVGAACYASACGLVAWLGNRLGGLRCAAAASFLLLTSVDFRLLSLSGMESSFAVVLGLAALALIVVERHTLAGVVIGLAVVNKLDAGLLAASVVIGFLVVHHQFPRRVALAAVAAAAPWLAFSTWYFGSPVPYSATQKLTVVKNPTHDADVLWVLRALGADRALGPLLLAALSLLVIPRLRRRAPALAVVGVAVVTWACLHLAFFSIADFGDPYGWYVTVLYPLVSLGAAVGIALVPDVVSDLVADPSRRRRVMAVTALAGVLALAAPKAPQVWRAAIVIAHGHEIDGYERLEGTRRAAGRYLGRATTPGEVIATCFGWIAYGAPENPIKETCPLSTRKPVAPPTWGVELEWPDSGALRLPDGATIEAVFSATGDRPGRTIVYRFADR